MDQGNANKEYQRSRGYMDVAYLFIDEAGHFDKSIQEELEPAITAYEEKSKGKTTHFAWESSHYRLSSLVHLFSFDLILVSDSLALSSNSLEIFLYSNRATLNE